MPARPISQQIPKFAFRVAQAANLIGVSPSTIYRLVDSKDLTLVKLGPRASAITRASLASYAEARGIPLPEAF